MGIATGLTAERMQEIIDRQILSGAVDLSGNLIMTRSDGTSFNAGEVKGAKGDSTKFEIPNYPSHASYGNRYVRLAVLDGINTAGGATVQFLLSGLGRYITPPKSTIIAHVAQRGSNAIFAEAWGWGDSEIANGDFKLFTRQTGEFMFEVWAYFYMHTAKPTYTELATWRSTLYFDSHTTEEPSNLVQIPIKSSDYVLPKNIDLDDLTVSNLTTTLNLLVQESLTTKSLRVTGTGDLSSTSTGHPFQVGPDDALNIGIDQNEIQARNNGAASHLLLNINGGELTLGNASSEVNVPGRIDGAHYPYAYAAGLVNVDTTFPFVSFPSNRFTVPPIVVAQLNSGAGGDVGLSVMVTSVTTTNFRLRHSGTSGTRGVFWQAIQMKTNAAAG